MQSIESRRPVVRFQAHQPADADRQAWDEVATLAIRWRLPREPWAGAEVRLRILLATKGLLSEDEQDLLRLLVTELINNSVQHGGAEAGTYVTVHLSIAHERLRVAVCDEGAGFDAAAVPHPAPGSGLHGLQLIDKLTARWGTYAGDGSCVWFELDQCDRAA